MMGDGPILVCGSVGCQINDVVTRLREIAAETGAVDSTPGTRLRVAMQQWFETPASLSRCSER